MDLDLELYVMQVRDRTSGNPVGTAYLMNSAGQDFIITCYHVISANPQFDLFFFPEKVAISAILDDPLSRQDWDIAILRPSSALPPGLQRLEIVQKSRSYLNKKFLSYGYPITLNPNGSQAKGVIENLVPTPPGMISANGRVLHLRTTDISEGMSGAPVVAPDGRLVGMVARYFSTTASSHADVAYAQPAESILSALLKRKPAGILSNRQEWLDLVGFEIDPFGGSDGSTDPNFKEYFVKVRGQWDILGEPSRPENVFVFSKKGVGKSSLRRMIAVLCRDLGALAVEYTNFSGLLSDLQNGKTIQGSSHLRAILQSTLDAIYLDKKDPGARVKWKADSLTDRDFFWAFCLEYESDPTHRIWFKDYLRINPSSSQAKLPDRESDQFRLLCQNACRLFGYQSVYLLIDPDHDVSPDLMEAWQVLKPLLQTGFLVDLRAAGVSTKIFLNQAFRAKIEDEVRWLKDVFRPPFTLTSDQVFLDAILKERISRCLPEKTNHWLKKSGDLFEEESLEKDIWSFAGDLPQSLIQIFDQLVAIHTRDPIGDRVKFTHEECEEVIVRLKAERDQRLVESLLTQDEGEQLEFKETLRYDLQLKKRNEVLEKVIAKTICAFMNQTGGSLLIGAADSKDSRGRHITSGLENDIATLARKDADGFLNELHNILKNYLGSTVSVLVKAEILIYNEKMFCLVKAPPAEEPVFLLDKGLHEYYVRSGSASDQFDPRRTLEHVRDRYKDYLLSVLRGPDNPII